MEMGETAIWSPTVTPPVPTPSPHTIPRPCLRYFSAPTAPTYQDFIPFYRQSQIKYSSNPLQMWPILPIITSLARGRQRNHLAVTAGNPKLGTNVCKVNGPFIRGLGGFHKGRKFASYGRDREGSNDHRPEGQDLIAMASSGRTWDWRAHCPLDVLLLQGILQQRRLRSSLLLPRERKK